MMCHYLSFSFISTEQRKQNPLSAAIAYRKCGTHGRELSTTLAHENNNKTIKTEGASAEKSE